MASCLSDLSALIQDERLSHLDDLPAYASHSGILTKMYKEQILKYSELQAFEESLMPHQRSVRYIVFIRFD